MGCLHALQVTGKRIPDEVAVIGCNNSVYCTICYPQLTSIDNSLHETGRMAAKQMIRLLNHESDVEKDHLPALPVGSAGYHPADAVGRRRSRHFFLGNTAQFPA